MTADEARTISDQNQLNETEDVVMPLVTAEAGKGNYVLDYTGPLKEQTLNELAKLGYEVTDLLKNEQVIRISWALK